MTSFHAIAENGGGVLAQRRKVCFILTSKAMITYFLKLGDGRKEPKLHRRCTIPEIASKLLDMYEMSSASLEVPEVDQTNETLTGTKVVQSDSIFKPI